MTSERLSCLIPARGGSKGVPRKNIKMLAGRPLLAYTADSALAAESLAVTVLSTDDEEIANVGRGCGLDVPFLRPADLAQDTTPSIDVVRHALDSLASADERFDAEVDAYVSRVALKSSSALMLSKRLLYQMDSMPFDVHSATIV